MFSLIDTHFHPDSETDDVTNNLDRARSCHVDAFIAVGADLASSRAVNEVAASTPDVWATAGVHPHAAAEFDGNMAPYRELARAPRNCAIGEIGLDYYYENSDREAQKEVFKKFLQLAAELDLPAVIHCRDAYADCLQILGNNLARGQKFEIHSFTGPEHFVKKFLEMGAFVSFNGIVTFKKADNVRQALDAVPVERLLLETDAPYLAPAPHRGGRNQPAYLTHIAEFIAEQKKVDLAELAERTTENARRFFRLL